MDNKLFEICNSNAKICHQMKHMMHLTFIVPQMTHVSFEVQ